MSSSHLFGSVYTLNGEIYLMARSFIFFVLNVAISSEWILGIFVSYHIFIGLVYAFQQTELATISNIPMFFLLLDFCASQ